MHMRIVVQFAYISAPDQSHEMKEDSIFFLFIT